MLTWQTEKEIKNKSPNLFQRIFPDNSKGETIKDRCLKAADYEGCMKYETGQSKSGEADRTTSESSKDDPLIIEASEFNKGKDCNSGDICLATGKENDMFGLPTLYDYWYLITSQATLQRVQELL